MLFSKHIPLSLTHTNTHTRRLAKGQSIIHIVQIERRSVTQHGGKHYSSPIVLLSPDFCVSLALFSSFYHPPPTFHLHLSFLSTSVLSSPFLPLSASLHAVFFSTIIFTGGKWQAVDHISCSQVAWWKAEMVLINDLNTSCGLFLLSDICRDQAETASGLFNSNRIMKGLSRHCSNNLIDSNESCRFLCFSANNASYQLFSTFSHLHDSLIACRFQNNRQVFSHLQCCLLKFRHQSTF